mmetsp:Transcript_13855/g.37053  ORF Transcript_13855/g.37053 Transcript_13855/m.37053 type:complete len:113 (-) Transcript_13855:447-785(-)
MHAHLHTHGKIMTCCLSTSQTSFDSMPFLQNFSLRAHHFTRFNTPQHMHWMPPNSRIAVTPCMAFPSTASYASKRAPHQTLHAPPHVQLDAAEPMDSNDVLHGFTNSSIRCH